MSAFTVDGDLVHYEKLGRGRPVILVHGWIGSWRYWVPLMQSLSLKYSVYALDLFGFGDSSKNTAHYSLDQQVRLIDEFMQKMGITKAVAIGHALGAMVLTHFAHKHQDKLAKLLLVSVPLFDPGGLDQRTPAGSRTLLTPLRTSQTPLPNNPSPTTPVETASELTIPSRSQAGSFNELPTIPRLTDEARERIRTTAEDVPSTPQPQPIMTLGNGAKDNPLLTMFSGNDLTALLGKAFKRSEVFYDKLKLDVDKADGAALTQSARGFDSGKMLDDLRTVSMPLVIVHGESDPILTAPSEQIWNYLTLEKEDTLVPIPLPGVRHFPMLEHEPFIRLTNDFLDSADISKLEVKERWRRRSR